MHARQSDLDVDIGALIAGLLRQWRRLLAIALAVAAVAFMLSTLATKHYRAETRILIETRESAFTRPDGAASDSPILDEQGVISQVEVIGSVDLLKRVAQELDLAALPEFRADAGQSLVARILSAFGLRSDPSALAPEERVLRSFREKLNVYRVSGSRVIVVEFSSEDPALAARVPNAIADAYIALQRDAKLASNADATDWLEPEIADLRDRVREAEGRVATFRSESDLLLGTSNSVLATQQMSELSSELSRVRAARASAEATARTVREALAGGGSIDSIPGVQASPLIQRLRENEVQLRAEIADLSATLLDNHPRLRALRSQLAGLGTQIRAEGRNVLDALETEARTAQSRETELVAGLNRLKAESARAGEAEVELRALEREAAAQRELLESYLSRFREASSRRDRNYLPADARIFSRASVPADHYFPKTVPITAAAFVATLLVLAVWALLSELFSGRAMRPADSARIEPIEDVAMRPIDVPPTVGDSSVAVDLPQRGVTPQMAADALVASGKRRAIFLSPEGDAASAASVLVAREVADSGLRVILMDLTVDGSAGGPMLDGVRRAGITDLLCSRAQFSEIIHADLYSDCHVIPLGTADPAEAMRSAERLPIIVSSLANAYDLVVVECGAADSGAIRRVAGEGSAILVGEIGTDRETIDEALEDLATAGHGEVTVVTAAFGSGEPVPGRDAA